MQPSTGMGQGGSFLRSFRVLVVALIDHHVVDVLLGALAQDGFVADHMMFAWKEKESIFTNISKHF